MSSNDHDQAETDTITFIGTATTLLNVDGLNILTDPTFLHDGRRIHLGGGLFTRRLIPPALTIEELPKIDLVLLTHTHQDHWDRGASEGLEKDIPIYTEKGAKKSLNKEGFTNVTSLEVGEMVQYHGLQILALPAQHGPRFLKPFTGPVIGFGVTSSNGKLWISGDTTGTKSLKQSLINFQPDVGIIYFGGVKAYIFRLTFDARDAAEIANEISSLQKYHAVHYDDWKHFRTKREDLIMGFEKFIESDRLELVFPPRGESIGLW